MVRPQTSFIYDEIFVRRCYCRHGIRVRDNDTVIDAGANVGLFAMFLLRGGAIGCMHGCVCAACHSISSVLR